MSLLRIQHRQAREAIFSILFVLLLGCAGTRAASAAAIPPALQAQQSDTAIVFYAQPQVSADVWPVLFQVVRTDLAAGEGELPNGAVLDKAPTFLRGTDDVRGISFSHIISVKLLGRCDGLPRVDRASLKGPLGWVLLVSGRIQPFVTIDCVRLAQLLRPATAGLTKEGRQYAMAQAIAHVLIHEWSHIVTQSSAHSARGLTQADLSVNDLITSPKSNQLSAASR
jgi:hypothetical protein